jgi:hypothetical protein
VLLEPCFPFYCLEFLDRGVEFRSAHNFDQQPNLLVRTSTAFGPAQLDKNWLWQAKIYDQSKHIDSEIKLCAGCLLAREVGCFRYRWQGVRFRKCRSFDVL